LPVGNPILYEWHFEAPCHELKPIFRRLILSKWKSHSLSGWSGNIALTSNYHQPGLGKVGEHWNSCSLFGIMSEISLSVLYELFSLFFQFSPRSPPCLHIPTPRLVSCLCIISSVKFSFELFWADCMLVAFGLLSFICHYGCLQVNFLVLKK
jgi:hypothetical protein